MYPNRIFRDRFHAGQILGREVEAVIRGSPVVLALPRGGVPVGFEVAQMIHGDLDIFLVRKIGVPRHEELAMGAIASGGVRVLNEGLIRELRISPDAVAAATTREKYELARRETLYREGRPPVPIRGRTVIVVDDGLATGVTMLAAARALRLQHVERIVVVVPVASREACQEFRTEVDEIICAFTPEPFYSVGVWYEDFSQTSDEEVRELLERATRERVA